MKVCMVSDQVFPAVGGEGIVTQNLCIRLSQRGHKVIILTSRVPHPPKIKDIEVIRFPAFSIPQKGYFATALWYQISSILKKRKIQIVHVNLPTFLGWQSFLAARKLDIPRIAGFHVQVGNVIPYDLPPFSFLKKLVELWFSYFYGLADFLISPSNLGKKILSRYLSGKVEVISNGVDLGIFNLDAVSLKEGKRFREKFRLKDSPFLLYVGRLSREKNVGYLLKIMQILTKKNFPVKLLIVGEGELKVLLQKKTFSMSLDKKVIFAGYLPERELLCAYKEADIFILPSLFELQSMVVVEAMAMGKPILVGRSSQSAACEMVKEGVNGYTFDLRDPLDAAEKVESILSNFSLKESMQKASLRIARDHDIQISISKVEDIYRRLL